MGGKPNKFYWLHFLLVALYLWLLQRMYGKMLDGCYKNQLGFLFYFIFFYIKAHDLMAWGRKSCQPKVVASHSFQWKQARCGLAQANSVTLWVKVDNNPISRWWMACLKRLEVIDIFDADMIVERTDETASTTTRRSIWRGRWDGAALYTDKSLGQIICVAYERVQVTHGSPPGWSPSSTLLPSASTTKQEVDVRELAAC